jgi:GNAT superfamily N-acetyltransferase
MSIAYHFGPLSTQIEEAYQRLFHEDGEMKSPERLRWRFKDAPHGLGYFATAHDTAADDRIVGIIGLIPTQLLLNGSKEHTFQAVDLIVDPAYRGKGIFSGLGRTLFEGAESLGAPLVWGFPNENAAPTWFGRFSWHQLGTAPFMMKPLRSGLFLRRLRPALRRRFDFPLSSRGGRELPEIREVERFGPEAGELWSAFAREVGCTLDRSADLLNWRLIDQPESSYRNVGGYEGGALRALVSTTLMRKHNSNICYVMEALSAPGDVPLLGRVLRAEIVRAAREGADLALAWCPPGAPNRAAFRRAGFLRFPDWLRPIKIYFGAKVLDERVAPVAGRRESWYISYVDSDTI